VMSTTAGDKKARRYPRLGLSFPTPLKGNGVPISGRELIEGAQQIEELGFHGIWIADAVGRGYFAPDPLVGLAAVAGATRRVELGTCILQVPLANPITLARRILSTALVGGGRLAVGVGAGSTAADFEAVGADFGGRFGSLEEALNIMKALWSGERVAAAQLDPWPNMLGGPPVLIGAWTGRWIERAASEFDGWIGSGAKAGSTRPDGSYRQATWDAVAAAVQRFRSHGGRRAILASVVADLDGDETAEPDRPVNLRCPPDEARRRLRRLTELGFDDVVVVSANRSQDHVASLAALTES
jgi:alkanesulfonate monooxygenase SsuD/methylene tetrahydromethanopterin reductase-like flavin-dependent oxidoreductase (luciferase family)